MHQVLSLYSSFGIIILLLWCSRLCARDQTSLITHVWQLATANRTIKRECINIHIHWQRPFKHQLPMFECQCLNSGRAITFNLKSAVTWSAVLPIIESSLPQLVCLARESIWQHGVEEYFGGADWYVSWSHSYLPTLFWLAASKESPGRMQSQPWLK